MKTIKLVGHVQLDKKLKECVNMEAVKRVVQKNGDQLNRRMKGKTKTAFTKGYSTGDTASSINTEMSKDGMTATVEPGMDYDPYVEFGTRFMEAEPFVRPAFEEQVQQFKKDMDKLVK